MTLHEDLEHHRAELRASITRLESKTHELAEANAILEERGRQLAALSRRAGMAEVAAGILHNVGNVLNSVTVGSHLAIERLQGWRPSQIGRAVTILEEHKGDLARFISEDARGKQILPYVHESAEYLEKERNLLMKDLDELRGHIGHIEAIIRKQQDYVVTSSSAMNERCSPAHLAEDAMTLVRASFGKGHLPMAQEFTSVPPVLIDRHRVLQILVNLMTNAVQALGEVDRTDKRVVVRLMPLDGERFVYQVTDNGVGIAPQSRERIFAHGFTTKPGGHGMGLHTSALAAKEMGGELSCESEGVGRGATFALTLPMRPAQEATS